MQDNEADRSVRSHGLRVLVLVDPQGTDKSTALRALRLDGYDQ